MMQLSDEAAGASRSPHLARIRSASSQNGTSRAQSFRTSERTASSNQPAATAAKSGPLSIATSCVSAAAAAGA